MTSPADAQAHAPAGEPLDQHPEVLVGAALAGGFLLAFLLKKLGPEE